MGVCKEAQTSTTQFEKIGLTSLNRGLRLGTGPALLATEPPVGLASDYMRCPDRSARRSENHLRNFGFRQDNPTKWNNAQSAVSAP